MSANVFFIGDTHFGHRNIVKWTRPHYTSVEDMNEGIIALWNTVVRPKDVVWHLGDVAFGKDNLACIGRCNGHKKLVMGNHDNCVIEEYLKYFDKLYGIVKYKEFVLSHVPVHPTQVEFSWLYNIHGHIHKPEKYNLDCRYINVNADAIGLIPISLEEIRTRIKLSTYINY